MHAAIIHWPLHTISTAIYASRQRQGTSEQQSDAARLVRHLACFKPAPKNKSSCCCRRFPYWGCWGMSALRLLQAKASCGLALLVCFVAVRYCGAGGAPFQQAVTSIDPTSGSLAGGTRCVRNLAARHFATRLSGCASTRHKVACVPSKLFR